MQSVEQRVFICTVHITVHTEHLVKMQHIKSNMQNSNLQNSDEFQMDSIFVIIIIISNLSNDRSKASSKMIPPHSAI